MVGAHLHGPQPRTGPQTRPVRGTAMAGNAPRDASEGEGRHRDGVETVMEGAAKKAWATLRLLWSESPIKRLSAYPSMSKLRLAEWDGSEPLPCAHREPHCVVYAFKGAVRGLLVGYGLRTAFTLATSLPTPRFLGAPLRGVIAVLLSRQSARFAVFFSLLGFVYRQLQCLLCKMTGRPSRFNSAVAAFFAGLTVVVESKEQRTTLAGFLFVRALYEACRTLAHYGFIGSYQYALPAIFGLCQVPIMYAFLREPRALNRGYHKWILRMAAMTPEQVHHITGLHAGFNPCAPVYHDGSCLAFNVRDWAHAVVCRASLVYLPVHVVPGLLFKTKHVLSRPADFLAGAAVGIVRSSLFLGTYISIVKGNVCLWRWVLQRVSSKAIRLAGLLTGFALLFEHPGRHGELVQYVVPRATETFFNLHKDRLPAWFNSLRSSSTVDLFLFCSALAMFVVAADTQPRLKGVNGAIFNALFGKSTHMIVPGGAGSPSVRQPRRGIRAAGAETGSRPPLPAPPRADSDRRRRREPYGSTPPMSPPTTESE